MVKGEKEAKDGRKKELESENFYDRVKNLSNDKGAGNPG
jgi:hypothetical protein